MQRRWVSFSIRPNKTFAQGKKYSLFFKKKKKTKYKDETANDERRWRLPLHTPLSIGTILILRISFSFNPSLFLPHLAVWAFLFGSDFGPASWCCSEPLALVCLGVFRFCSVQGFFFRRRYSRPSLCRSTWILLQKADLTFFLSSTNLESFVCTYLDFRFSL